MKSTQDLIICTLPEYLKETGSQLIATSKASVEKQLKGCENKHQRHRHAVRDNTDQEVESEELIEKIKTRVEKVALPITIARLIMELWSPKMRQHAEKLVLQKAIEEQYLRESLLKWVHVLEESDKERNDNDWFIENQDEAILELIWNRFSVKEHFCQVYNHRKWIQRSYDHLKDYIPNLSAEIIERHDLSKFAFSQAIGYTLRWVHNTPHKIWKTACDLHLQNEPHHPQTWSNLHKPKEKLRKLENWLKAVCDFHKGLPYGLDITDLDLNSEDMAEPFLLESFIDMIAVEWERKKGQRLNITMRELVSMDDKFLNRYSETQHQMISNLIEKISSESEFSSKGTADENISPY